jgi:predicted GNAT family acetyltransferase
MTAVDVRHDPAHHRFEAVVEGFRCVADYELAPGGVMWMTHTGVPSPVGGRGIAEQLVQAALDWARAQGLKVEPSCSYVRTYMRRHPETLDLMAR